MSNVAAAAENINRWRQAPRGILQYVEEQFGATVAGSRMTGTIATVNCTIAVGGSIDLTKQ